MPGWSPNWGDVQFDYAAAQDYVDSCRVLASTLREWLHERANLAKRARKHWEGPHRDRFDRDFERIQREASAIADQLTQSAHSVLRAADEARSEQSRRVWQRAEWHAENAREIQMAEDIRRMEEARIMAELVAKAAAAEAAQTAA
jgi:hypothetical protein